MREMGGLHIACVKVQWKGERRRNICGWRRGEGKVPMFGS